MPYERVCAMRVCQGMILYEHAGGIQVWQGLVSYKNVVLYGASGGVGVGGMGWSVVICLLKQLPTLFAILPPNYINLFGCKRF